MTQGAASTMTILQGSIPASGQYLVHAVVHAESAASGQDINLTCFLVGVGATTDSGTLRTSALTAPDPTTFVAEKTAAGSIPLQTLLTTGANATQLSLVCENGGPTVDLTSSMTLIQIGSSVLGPTGQQGPTGPA